MSRARVTVGEAARTHGVHGDLTFRRGLAWGRIVRLRGDRWQVLSPTGGAWRPVGIVTVALDGLRGDDLEGAIETSCGWLVGK